jgi:hypothetical protein
VGELGERRERLVEMDRPKAHPLILDLRSVFVNELPANRAVCVAMTLEEVGQ